MTEVVTDGPERLLCDTSFVGATASGPRPSWATGVVARINRSILAISVITLAEARYGFRYANWNQARVSREEDRLAGFLQIPMDLEVIDEWARLKTLNRRQGWNIGDNDLWIAATASVRGYPLVTCDKDHQRIEDPALEIIFLEI